MNTNNLLTRNLNYRELKKELNSQNYFLDDFTLRKLVNYLALGKPIGLRGEPGIGKSELPERIASILSAKFIDIECHSQLEASDIGVSWNAFRQIVDSQAGRLDHPPFSIEYLNKTPLIESLFSTVPVVLRVDEIDKLNETTSNFFLRYLDKRELIVHDLDSSNKTIKSKVPIMVFLTSNEYNELDPAIMRRIAWLELTFPSEEMLTRIIEKNIEVERSIAKRAAYVVLKLRTLDLKKRPSIGEAIEWTKALMIESNGKITLDSISVTLGLLLKYSEDEQKGWKEIQSWID